MRLLSTTSVYYLMHEIGYHLSDRLLTHEALSHGLNAQLAAKSYYFNFNR